ncbi:MULTISPECIES: hypothetical protein [unclassified Kitasatospora]|uniref:hypothetical protein n=1 Tax=unclassified Kitasatospora TaxID=2633591 RepID=UPI0012FA7EA8|nr:MULTISPECIES: hypothetical protein [unclassified Kitasatospora]
MHETSSLSVSDIVHDPATDRFATLPYIERSWNSGPASARTSGGGAMTVHGVEA